MDPFETFDVTLFPNRVVLMPAFTAPPYVDVDPEGDLKLLRHLLSSAEMDALASGLLREYALNWPAVRLEEVEADTHSVVVARVMEAVEVGALVGAVADLNDIIRPVRMQEISEIGAQDIVRGSGRSGVTPFYEDKLLQALRLLPETVTRRISARAGKQLEPFFTGKSLNLTAGVFVVWCGKRSVGTEYVIDGGLLGVIFAYVGWESWKACDLMWQFFTKVDAARSEFHIQRAVNDLADAIHMTGVHGFLAMLRSVTPKVDESSGGGGGAGGDSGARKRSDLSGGGKAGGTALEEKTKSTGGGGRSSSPPPPKAQSKPAPAPKPAKPAVPEQTYTQTGSGDGMRRRCDAGGKKFQINSGHAYDRAHKGGDVRESGLSRDQIENAIVNDLLTEQDISTIPRVPRYVDKVVEVEGYAVGYRVNVLPNGTVNIGTYFPG